MCETTPFKNFFYGCEILRRQSVFLMVFLSRGDLKIIFFCCSVRKLSTSGVLQRLERKWVLRELPTKVKVQEMPEVSINHVNGIIYLYISMIFVSLFILGVEVFLFNRSKDKLMKKAHFANWQVKFKLTNRFIENILWRKHKIEDSN